MYTFVQSTHSHMRWLIMLTAVLAIVLPMLNQNHSSKSKTPGLVFMIFCDLQLLLGLLLYFGLSPFGVNSFGAGMSTIMKTPEIRKIVVEHFTLMLLAIAMVHIGYSKIKKATDQNTVKKLSLKFFGIALVLILLGIPWYKL